MFSQSWWGLGSGQRGLRGQSARWGREVHQAGVLDIIGREKPLKGA
jgi:hypothetical protein